MGFKFREEFGWFFFNIQLSSNGSDSEQDFRKTAEQERNAFNPFMLGEKFLEFLEAAREHKV